MRLDRWAYWLWCLAAFGLPLGTAPAVLFSGLAALVSLLSWLVHWQSPVDRAIAGQALHQSPTAARGLIWACLALFVWLSLSAVWSVAPGPELMESWSRYRRLLYIPMAAWGLWVLSRGLMRVEPQTRAADDGFGGMGWLGWFATGASLSAAVSWLAYLGLTGLWFGDGLGQAGAWSWDQVLVRFPPASNPAFGHSHIAAGAFLVLAGNAWLALTRWRWWGIGLAAFTVTPVVLMQGRTGYLLLLVSLIFWFGLGLVRLLRLLARSRQKSITHQTQPVSGTDAGTWTEMDHGPGLGQTSFLLVSGVVLMLVWAQISPHLGWRSQQAASEVQSYVQTQPVAPVTSQGIRLALWQAGFDMSTSAASRLVFGFGVGGYAQGYRDLRGQPTPEGSGQPHSEYVALLVQGGLVGLGLWLWILVQALVLAWRLRPLSQRFFWLLVLTLLMLDAGFNSVLWNLEEGHLMVLLLGGLVARSLASVDPDRLPR